MENVKVEFELGPLHGAMLQRLTELTRAASPNAVAKELIEAIFNDDLETSNDQLPN